MTAANTPAPRSLILRYRGLMEPRSWKLFSTGLALGVVNGLVTGAALLALLPATLALATGEAHWGLVFSQWLIVLAVCAILAVASDFMGQRFAMLGVLGFIPDTHHKIGDKIATLPLHWFTAESAGVLSRAVTKELFDLAESGAHFLFKVFSTVSAAVVIWAGSWAWDVRLGLFLTVSAPVLAGILALSRRLLNHGKAILEPRERELAARIVEYSRCQGALRSCHAAGDYAQLDSAFDECLRTSRRTLWWESAANVLSGAFTQIIIVTMIVLTAGFAVSGAMEPLVAVATIGICLRFTTMLEDMSATLMGVEDRRQIMNHIHEVMDADVLPEPEVSAKMNAPGQVEFVDVRFAYVKGTQVLDGVSLLVPDKSMCAIVGPSGSGKTTIARLVARFWDVDEGSVRVGGADVRELTGADLMKQVSLVFQDVYLFDDTLDANIRIGRPDASEEEVRRAADLAGVTEIVQRLPDGWDSRVGEGGRALSGGERQRVSIARALLKRAPIVLFDEATSALDAENESHIVAAMEELRRTSTLIVIAHKLETIQRADQVVVLGSNGRIAQRGSHDSLVNVEGPYRDFWEYRSRSKGWTLVL
ncbi:ABC transporter ATP-binding protein [Schaalia sp. 19OD2882]|nr:ABC transporter ATP-binding protein [Schaalia sp. 19OD2882]